MKIGSWNVNGIRACERKGFSKWISRSGLDLILLQEIRADEHQIPDEISSLRKYEKIWNPATSKKGYSGTGILTKEKPLKVYQGIGKKDFDCEGRVLGIELEKLFAVSAYFPNSQDEGKRLKYKLNFCDALASWLNRLRRKGKPVLLGGDFNIAHQPIDLARPKENENCPGYFPEEREWIGGFFESGWIDTFRSLYPQKVRYSWWSNWGKAREKNIGWRIDYHSIHKQDQGLVLKADVKDKVLGSDHCPVTLELDC